MRKVILLLCLILACAHALCAQKPIAVDATDIEKHILVKPKLEFPEVMCAAHVIGTVVMDVDINEQGKVVKETIISGPQMLKEYALAYVKQWKFTPFNENGHLVTVRGRVSVRIDSAEGAKN